MTSRQFIGAFLAGAAGIAALVIPFNMYVDVYGIFRTAHGRRLSLYGEERLAKYLHTFRYIPENFDGVLLGSSVSDNLETERLGRYRIYNASINGGNVEDIKPLAENLFRRGEMQLTVFCIHRYLTLDHVKKTDLMTPRQYWGALGSPQLIGAYVSGLAVRGGLIEPAYDACGARREAEADLRVSRKAILDSIPGIAQGTALAGNYSIDPVALAELKSILSAARQHSRRLLVFHPPLPEPVLAVRAQQFEHYRDTINAMLEPGDLVVDFNGPQYAAMRADYRNFADAVHLSRAGARFVVAELGKALAGNPAGAETAERF